MILVDIEMPKSCRECPIVHDEIYCSITHKSVLDQSIDFMKERLPNCPIIDEVPLMRYQAKFLCEIIKEQEKTALQ